MKTLLRWTFLLALPLLILPACHCLDDDDSPAGKDRSVIGKYLLLQIDYQTLEFEGGKLFDVLGTAPAVDSLPVDVVYNSPGDFGDLGLYSSLDSSRLFFGTIVWAGRGDRVFPAELDDPATFSTTGDVPDILPLIKELTPPRAPEPVDPGVLWEAISHLSVAIDAALTENSRFGYVFYPRSVGVGDPAEWDYIIVAYVPD